MRGFGRLVAIAGSAISVMASEAQGLDFRLASDADLPPIQWSGFVAVPYFGYETLHLDGAGGDVLKDPQGWRVGGELDRDFQFGSLVVGIAGDAYYTWYDGDGANSWPQLSSRLHNYETVRGRLGYATGRWLVFATGGYALGDLSVQNDASGVEDRHTLSGWTAGAGLEWVWNKDLTLRGELAHIDLASEKFDSLPAGNQDLGATLDLFKITFVSRF